ncbi:MAG: serine/threonine-protein kinase [Oscillospiraceae bacterium]|nr:serine/threonine-protein kinase [Oscillospiraceae bacterium]
MSRLGRALLSDGNEIEYVITDNPPRGGMKYTYFTPDKSYVIQFFNNREDAEDPQLQERIKAIIGKYNPTLSEAHGGANGNDELTAAYFAKRFCWPVAIVVRPEFGIVCPAYPPNFFFDANASQILKLQGKDKKSNWFTNKNRKYLNSQELGNFRSMLQMSLLLARSLRRMHQAGLAHSDLSFNNVLIDPKSGTCVIIDIDSLVVPGLFPPEVIGTRGYVAPEVLETLGLPNDKRNFPGLYTDLHSMAVLIYEYIFLRHPLMGPKIYSQDAEQDDYLGLGKLATFIEDPDDTSNRPDSLDVKISDMGPYLEQLFIRSLSKGLHSPDLRPTAMEWENGLVKTWNMLHSCSNPNCEKKYFIMHDMKNPVCPFCRTRVKDKTLLRLSFMTQRRGSSGRWFKTADLVAENNTPICLWDLYANVFPDEKTSDRSVKAYIRYCDGQYYLVNLGQNNLLSPRGNLVPIGYSVQLQDGMIFRLVRDENSHLIKVDMFENNK